MKIMYEQNGNINEEIENIRKFLLLKVKTIIMGKKTILLEGFKNRFEQKEGKITKLEDK